MLYVIATRIRKHCYDKREDNKSDTLEKILQIFLHRLPLSQVTNLDNQTDSVNFNEIVRVSPPPSGYHHLIVRSCGTTSQIESFIIIISSYHHHVIIILPSWSYYHHPHHHVQTCSTYCVPKWPMEVQPSSTSPTMKSKQVEHILPSSPLFIIHQFKGRQYWWFHDRYGRSTASSQYFLQLAGYLGQSFFL